jgi:hypothetical protein
MPVRSCDLGTSKNFIDQRGTSQTRATISRATHSAMLRWPPPGGVLTMNFRVDRVTVHLGSKGKITALDCG